MTHYNSQYEETAHAMAVGWWVIAVFVVIAGCFQSMPATVGLGIILVCWTATAAADACIRGPRQP